METLEFLRNVNFTIWAIWILPCFAGQVYHRTEYQFPDWSLYVLVLIGCLNAVFSVSILVVWIWI